MTMLERAKAHSAPKGWRRNAARVANEAELADLLRAYMAGEITGPQYAAGRQWTSSAARTNQRIGADALRLLRNGYRLAPPERAR